MAGYVGQTVFTHQTKHLLQLNTDTHHGPKNSHVCGQADSHVGGRAAVKKVARYKLDALSKGGVPQLPRLLDHGGPA